MIYSQCRLPPFPTIFLLHGATSLLDDHLYGQLLSSRF
ncbi:unnamed protein product [Victoria cruziana]